MNKPIVILTATIALILLFGLAACSPLEQNQSLPAQVEPADACPTAPLIVRTETASTASSCDSSAQPAFYGLWLMEQNNQSALLTITERSIYKVEFDGGGDGYVRETFYEVKDMDLVNGILSLKMAWIRINGKGMGFDDPAKLMKVSVENDTLFFSIDSEELGAPIIAEIGPWVRQ